MCKSIKKNGVFKKLYSFHGQKMAHGIPLIVNGVRVLAAYKGDEIVGYITLEELNQEFYTRKLPEYNLKF